ncbi:MAG TPA: response regulator transcription factor [Acidimicrobiales bacterium]|nr:response regulator transcription factor [Acidimicrobiales bacterium]
MSDRDIVRAGVAAVLRPYRERVTVAGVAAGAADALSQQATSSADIVVLDARLASGDGLDAVDQVTEAWGDHRVVVLAGPDEARFAQPVLQRGAAGFLLVTIAGEELVEQLERVRDDAVVLDASLASAERHLDHLDPGPLWPGAQLGLTEQQSKVLELVAHGDRTTMVAVHLGMSEMEVKSHLRSAYRRLDVPDRPHALARLAEAGVFR